MPTAITLSVPSAASLGMNYYHESMGYIARSVAQIDSDLSLIRQVTMRVKIYHNPYNTGTQALCTLICQHAKAQGMYVVWIENMEQQILTDSTTNTGATPAQYPWSDYTTRVVSDASSATSAGADEFVVGNEISIHNNSDPGYSDSNLPNRIKTLVASCRSSFTGIIGYEEGWWKDQVWATQGISGVDKLYFDLYEAYNNFEVHLAFMVANFPRGMVELGEMSTWQNYNGLNANEDDWTRDLLRRYDQVRQAGMRAYLFCFREPGNNGYGLFQDTPPTLSHEIWTFLTGQYSYVYQQYFYETFPGATTQDFFGDGTTVAGVLQCAEFNTGAFLPSPVSDYVFRGQITLNSQSGSDSWRAARLVVRYGDANNYYFLNFNTNNTAIQLWRRFNGVESMLSGITQVTALGIVYDFEVRVQGTGSRTHLVALWNGVKIADVLDSGNTSTGPTLNQGNPGMKNNGMVASLDLVYLHDIEGKTAIVPSALVTTIAQTPALLMSAPSLPRFGIGTFQPVSNVNLYQGGFPVAGQSGPIHPWAGSWHGLYGFVLDTTIRHPQQVVYTPATQVGIDGSGVVVVRGFPAMTWSWTTLRPDYWYALIFTYKMAYGAPPGFKGLVLLQYPDTSSNTPQLVLARMDPPTHSSRDVGSFQGVTVHFSYLGQALLAPGMLVQILS